MATESPPTVTADETPVTFTTRRGVATAAFSLGLWASLTFWWYPFGMWVGLIALSLGTTAQVMGWRANSQRDNLALVGQVLGAGAVAACYTCYRIMQYFFEGYTPNWP